MPLPSAFETLSLLAGAGRPAVFLDYDGTLTPIVNQPAQATLAPSMRRAIGRLAQIADVGIVSGRQLDDLIPRVDVQGIAYAGSHGFDVQHVDGHRTVHGDANAYVDDVRSATRTLDRLLHSTEGVFIEEKRFCVAVHYRLVPRDWVQYTCDLVLKTAAAFPRLQAIPGKEVLDLRPRTDWNKGAAVTLLAGELAAPPSALVFIGDDYTDEDAFCAIGPHGIGIAVGEGWTTAARFRLADTADVHTWVTALVTLLTNRATNTDSSD